MRAFRLHARRVWDRGAVAGVWNKDALFLPETAPIYPYVLKAKVGFRVAWDTKEELARVAARTLETDPPRA